MIDSPVRPYTEGEIQGKIFVSAQTAACCRAYLFRLPVFDETMKMTNCCFIVSMHSMHAYYVQYHYFGESPITRPTTLPRWAACKHACKVS